MSSPGFDARWDVGVPGWTNESGRHVRLIDILKNTDNPETYMKEHRAAVLYLLLSYNKLHDEFLEAEEYLENR